ncbi:MAG TPA: flagellar filament capping protein FliD [Planctomycetota bacterium]|nr:flagellar filament capping protein FliD [Planctomycetota bacterium]
MASPISFSGLASGLDTSAIIAALVEAEKLPILALEQQKTIEKKKIDLFGLLEGYLADLSKKAEALQDFDGFLAKQVQASEEGVAALSVTSSALAGSHTLEVNALASADRWSFVGVPDHTANLATGPGQTVDFTYDGVAYSVAIDEAASSLEDIREAIETATGGAVDASVVNTGTESSPSYVLVVAGSQTGADFALTGLATSVGGLALDQQLTVASNAEITLDGLAIQRSTNDFSNVLPGLSITAQSLASGPTEAITFTISADTEAIQAGVQEFIDLYNKAIGFINSQNEYSEDEGPGGDLFGDSALRTVRSALNDALFGPGAVDSTSAFGSLGLVGIKLAVDGTLSLDAAKFQAKLGEDIDAFADLFADLDGFDNAGALEGTPEFYVDTSADSGVFSRLVQGLAKLLDDQTDVNGNTLKGLLDNKQATAQKNVDRIDDQIEQLELRLEKFEAGLVAQFTALETLLAGLQTQEQSLLALQNLGNFNQQS